MKLPRDFGGKIFPVTRDSINKYWMKAKKKAVVKDLMWRDLRRTGITWMFEKKGLRQIVGEDAVLTQSNISEIYTHDWAHDKIGRCLASFNIFLQRLI